MADEYILSFDFGSINMAYNMMDIKTKKIVKWDKFSIKDSTNEGSCEKLAKYLDTSDILSVKNDKDEQPSIIIVLEQQPRCNIKTITISGQLQMYFVLQKMININDKNICKINKIVGYHAKYKLKYYERIEGEEIIDVSKLKDGHYKNKKLAIEQTDRILKRNNENWIDTFNDKKKRDDLADCLLQNLAYMKFNLKIT